MEIILNSTKLKDKKENMLLAEYVLPGELFGVSYLEGAPNNFFLLVKSNDGIIFVNDGSADANEYAGDYPFNGMDKQMMKDDDYEFFKFNHKDISITLPTPTL